MLKLFVRRWIIFFSTVMSCGLSFLLSFFIMTSSLACDSSSISVDICHLKKFLLYMKRARVNKKHRKMLHDIVTSDLSHVSLEKLTELLPVMRNFLRQKLSVTNHSANDMQLMAISYLSALQNAFDVLVLNNTSEKFLAKKVIQEVDTLFTELPDQYSAFVIRAPNVDVMGNGSHQITEDQFVSYLTINLEKICSSLDVLLSIESSVDLFGSDIETLSSKLDAISSMDLNLNVKILDSKLDFIASQLNNAMLNVEMVSSVIDSFVEIDTAIDMLIPILSSVDAITENLNVVSDINLSKLEQVDINLDIIQNSASKIDTIAYKSSQNNVQSSDILMRLSSIITQGGDLDQIESCIDVIKSDIDIVIAIIQGP